MRPIVRVWSSSRTRSAWSRRLDQVQDAREQGMRLTRPADVNHGRALQFGGEHIDDDSRTSSSSKPKVPSMSTHGGSCSKMRATARQSCSSWLNSLIPPVGRIEQRREALETQPVERACESGLAEALGLRRIGENLAQSTARHVGRAAGQVEDLLALGARDAARAPRPQARQRSETAASCRFPARPE